MKKVAKKIYQYNLISFNHNQNQNIIYLIILICLMIKRKSQKINQFIQIIKQKINKIISIKC